MVFKKNIENPIEIDDVKSGLVKRSRESIMSAYFNTSLSR